MKERKLTIDIVKANIYCIILTVAALVVGGILWYVIWGGIGELFPESGNATEEEMDVEAIWIGIKSLAAIVAIMAGPAVHELVHGITWAAYAKSGWKSISFGVIWKMLTPYCHCDEPLKVKHYVTGALMPLLVVGIIPMALGLCLHSIFLVIFGAVYIGGATGDLMVVWLLRHEPAENTVLDHPSEPGCLIYEED